MRLQFFFPELIQHKYSVQRYDHGVCELEVEHRLRTEDVRSAPHIAGTRASVELVKQTWRRQAHKAKILGKQRKRVRVRERARRSSGFTVGGSGQGVALMEGAGGARWTSCGLRRDCGLWLEVV